jgi:hypothetical protein
MLRPSTRVLLVAFVSATSLFGCGSAPPATDILGVITLDGKKAKVPGHLEIDFVDCTGKRNIARIEEDGTYHVGGVAAGETKVYFISIGREALDMASRGVGYVSMKADGPQQELVPDIPNPIPLKMREALTSGLTFTVKPGQKNAFDFNIPPP